MTTGFNSIWELLGIPCSRGSLAQDSSLLKKLITKVISRRSSRTLLVISLQEVQVDVHVHIDGEEVVVVLVGLLLFVFSFLVQAYKLQ